jgi:conjugal transfer pilus assembly protein TraW
LITAVAWLACTLPLQAGVLGTYGATYRIAEKDALAEIEGRAAQVEWGRILDRKKLENYQGPPDRGSLPRAKRSRTFLVDMSFTTGIDVPDGRGGIVYPRGYSFNPLDYVTYPRTLVVINGSDPEQVRWFRSSEYSRRLDVTLLLTGGRFGPLSTTLDRPLFYADRRITERFRLTALPAIIRQKGRMMAVTETAVHSPGRTGRKTSQRPGKESP